MLRYVPSAIIMNSFDLNSYDSTIAIYISIVHRRRIARSVIP